MKQTAVLTKILAIIGTVLLLLPILAMFVFGAFSYFGNGAFRVDYLIPAEVFLLVLVGLGLLLWACLRAGAYRKWIAWAGGFAVVLLVGSQALAVVTGLASGEATQPELWQPIVLGMLAAYDLAIAAAGLGGILLLLHVFHQTIHPPS